MDIRTDALTHKKIQPPVRFRHKPISMIGKWFHSHHEDGSLNWQGQIIGQSKNRVRVQLYEWVLGYPSDKVSAPLLDVEGWTVYDTNEEMREAGAAYLAVMRA